VKGPGVKIAPVSQYYHKQLFEQYERRRVKCIMEQNIPMANFNFFFVISYPVYILCIIVLWI